jgi:hypothetical protein
LGQISSFGVPKTLYQREIKEWAISQEARRHIDFRAGHHYLKMRKSSSISESPGKSGSLFNISANMQPIDQASTGVE